MKLAAILAITNYIGSTASVINNMFIAKRIRLCPFQQFLVGTTASLLEELLLNLTALDGSLPLHAKLVYIAKTALINAVVVIAFQNCSPAKRSLDMIHTINIIGIICSFANSFVRYIDSGEPWWVCIFASLAPCYANEIFSALIRFAFTDNREIFVDEFIKSTFRYCIISAASIMYYTFCRT